MAYNLNNPYLKDEVWTNFFLFTHQYYSIPLQSNFSQIK